MNKQQLQLVATLLRVAQKSSFGYRTTLRDTHAREV
jgi:hypothetical protein